MADHVSKSERSRIMSLVKQKNTKPELLVRSYLHKNGLRFRLHDRRLPGSPDLVFPMYHTVVFVNGCFWHGHESSQCRRATIPKTNEGYWREKIANNKLRDLRNIFQLENDGWRVLVVWECQIKQSELSLLVDTIRRNKKSDHFSY
ncbi:very short patch repair endonuclease [Pseudodesulfovibrio methanolicus]|uniref:Very short patch repair endonuclease n=1 Tax=Pseudodesulfovibrio methanolicus TaxID=3126690 RepID=A0ABZ2IY83_9BACT